MIGHTVSHYRILQRIGGGGMGLVYKAEDLKLRRHVALKFLAPELTRDEDAKKRFLHEAQAASALDHPNICSIYEIDETPEGQVFIAMACYEGESVRMRIARRKIEPREAFEIAYCVAQGLARAHMGGIIHRDIKPANVMITSDGYVKIIDFGLSKLVGRSRVTGSGAALGTVAYMSPEQARSEESDARSDIWSLGALLYEMITGRLPFRGDIDQAMVYSILNEPPVPMRDVREDVPGALVAIVMKCLEKNPADRYQSAVEFCDAVLDASHELGWGESFSGGAVRPVSMVGAGRPRRRGVRPWMLVAAGALVVAAAVLGWMRWRDAAIYSTDVRLAVMPFERVGGTPPQAFVDGLGEWVAGAFERAGYRRESMWTVPFPVVFSDRPADVDVARDAYGINHVVTGRVQRFGDGHRLSIDLVDVGRGRSPRTHRVHVLLDDRAGAALQDSLGAAVLALLGGDASDEDLAAVVGRSTRDAGAFRAFVTGCGELLRARDPELPAPGVDSLRAAVAADPTYAPAWVKLGEAEHAAYGRDGDQVHLERAWEAVLTALRQDTTRVDACELASILAIRGGQRREAVSYLVRAHRLEPRDIGVLERLAVNSVSEKRFDEAENFYHRARDVAPDYAPVHAGLGWLYSRLGRHDEELASTLRAVQLAPGNLYALNRLGSCYYARDEFALAREYWARAFTLRPDCQNSGNLGLVTYLEGRFDESVRYYEYVIEQCDSTGVDNWANLAAALYWTKDRRGESRAAYRRAIQRAEQWLATRPDDGGMMAELADYHAMAGDTLRAREMIGRASAYTGEDISAHIAFACARLGEEDRALEFAGDAVRRGYPLSVIRRDPLFKDLVGDPRFRQMVELAGRGQESR